MRTGWNIQGSGLFLLPVCNGGKFKRLLTKIMMSCSTERVTGHFWSCQFDQRHQSWYSTGQGFFHQSACPRLVIFFAPRDPALPSAHSPPATVFFPTAIRRGSTAERSSYLYNHAVGSPGVDDENIWRQNDWQLRKIDTKTMLKRLMRTVRHKNLLFLQNI